MKVILRDQIIEINPDEGEGVGGFHVFTNDIAMVVYCAQAMFRDKMTITLESICYSLEVKTTKGTGAIRFRLIAKETGQVYPVPSNRILMQVVAALVTLQQRRLTGDQECQP